MSSIRFDYVKVDRRVKHANVMNRDQTFEVSKTLKVLLSMLYPILG